MNTNEELCKHIYECECELLKSDVRKSEDKISQLLSKDYTEFTSSGKVYYYKVGEVFQGKNDNTELDWQIRDFSIKELSHVCVLAMYKVIKNNEVEESKKYSLRSSIWKCFDGTWKMIFHQGTITTKI